MTKVMTALLVLEANPDLDTPVTLPEDIFPALQTEKASMAGFLPDETATVRDLLYGALLPSGAECCEALAREVSGSEEAFVASMNQKAAALGMASTHFCNPTGLHDPEHVSTVRDMARLLRAAMQNEMFRTIFLQQPATPCRPRICTRTALRWRAHFGANWTLARSCAGEKISGRQNGLYQRCGALSGKCRTGEGETVHSRHGGGAGKPQHRALPRR